VYEKNKRKRKQQQKQKLIKQGKFEQELSSEQEDSLEMKKVRS
jgi:hypothetical protein